ncbi:MAG TPA: glycosyltransferase family 2 protein [Pyrinomonadaceae bacterium]|nr:glycosyltransferase family 2 protein [Pyrinomonadaceae bacterium]
MNFSIAMCTFNGADYLQAQLDSLANQTLKPGELIVCDDGSIDATHEILSDFAGEAPFPVSVKINKNKLGVVQNFAQAIELCSGEVIALCDQDDVWHPQKLERLMTAFNGTSRPGLVFSDAEIVDKDLQPMHVTLWQTIKFDEKQRKSLSSEKFEFLAPGWTVTGATLAFRSEYRALCLPIPTNLPMIHDGWIALTIAAVAPVVAIAEPLIKYRRHSNQHTGLPDPEDTESPNNRSLRGALQRQTSYSNLPLILSTLRERLETNRAVFDCEKGLRRTEQYLKHLKERAVMRSRKLGRIPAVIRELTSLRYHRYSNGFRSAAKDLLSLRTHQLK